MNELIKKNAYNQECLELIFDFYYVHEKESLWKVYIYIAVLFRLTNQRIVGCSLTVLAVIVVVRVSPGYDETIPYGVRGASPIRTLKSLN